MPKASQETIIKELQESYRMELETVTNYLAISIDLDGVRAEEIKKSLAVDIAEELMHARQLGERIKQLSGFVPGSLALKFSQKTLQPPSDTTDVPASSKGLLRRRRKQSASTTRSFASVMVTTM